MAYLSRISYVHQFIFSALSSFLWVISFYSLYLSPGAGWRRGEGACLTLESPEWHVTSPKRHRVRGMKKFNYDNSMQGSGGIEDYNYIFAWHWNFGREIAVA